jgi:hypothetical protein
MSAREQLVGTAVTVGAITSPAVATLLGVSRASAQGHLLAARRAGLLRGERPLTTVPTLYTATAAGRRLVGIDVDPPHVTAANAAHLAAVAGVAATMVGRHTDHEVAGEADLRRREALAGHALASATLPGGRLHRPDLVLWPDCNGLPVAIEVELTVKAPRRLAEIVLAWARCTRVAGTLYCTTPATQRALARALEQARAHERVLLIPLHALGL